MATSFILIAGAAMAGEASVSVVIRGKDGSRIASAVIEKGRQTAFSAAVTGIDGKPSSVAVEWKAEPADVLKIEPSKGGRVAVTALRDWFDEFPAREPTARLTACAAGTCETAVITAVPDVAGRWPTKLVAEGLFSGSEVRNLAFVQNGRFIAFDPEPHERPDPARIATLRLDGNVLKLVKKGSILTVFDGALVDRSTGNGRWASSWGFSGSWTAQRSP